MKLHKILILFFNLAFVLHASAEDPISTGLFNNVAVSGYDTVAYFTEGRAVEGMKKYTSEYMGAEFRFASAENKARFDAEPARFAPQYGGYCAWAVSQGQTARSDPLQWTIVDSKLYLNYNSKIRERWERDIPGHIAAADENWPAVIE